MTINLSMPATHQLKPRITVVGVGGAGGNAVNNMITSHLEGVEFVVTNTDAQALAQSLSERRIQLGISITQGLGAGSQPDVGRAAAEEANDEIIEHLEGSNMVFITAGMGGGTGTGGAPVVARAAREMGILTVGVVTKPFQFEGVHRMTIAEEGLDELQKYVDTLIIIPNQNLFRVANEQTTFADAFKMADDVLYSGVRGVTDLMVMPGLINLDFADVRSVMAEMGKAMMGTGEAEGEGRALNAAEAAISNPLLDDVSMAGARGVLINITGGHDMTLFEVDEAANRIRDEVDPSANIIFGSTFDEELAGRMRVSVVSTGIGLDSSVRPRPAIAVAVKPVLVKADETTESAMETPDREEPGAMVAESAMLSPESAPQAAPQAVPQAELEAELEAEQEGQQETAPEPEQPVTEAPTVEASVDELVKELAKVTATPAPAEAEPEAAPKAESILETAGDARAPATRFIPPPPVSPGPKSTLSSNAEPFAGAAMKNGGAPPPKNALSRGLSLFERVTGSGKARSEAPSAQPAVKTEPVLQAAVATPEPASEGAAKPAESLALPKVEEDVLDIPAFLRRLST
ncbi:MAG: cell division protein FtsZ [Alphaproteobacteria bacterium]